jgi:hypothetical protein
MCVRPSSHIHPRPVHQIGARPDSAFSQRIDWCCLNRGVNVVAIQKDFGQEKVLIGGNFAEVGTNEYFGLARLNEDASVDTSFVGGAHSPVVDIQLWNNKFYAATEQVVTRHSDDGRIDETFSTPPYDGLKYQRILPYSDGRLLALLNSCCSRIVRRHQSDGTIDKNFVVTTDGVAITAALQADEGIPLGGTFTEVNCTRRIYLTRLIPSDTPDPLSCIPPVPEPEPPLDVTRIRGAKMVCCWPTNYPEYTLQATRRLRPKQPEKEKWVTVTNTPVLNESSLCVTNRILRWGRHYRLVKE